MNENDIDKLFFCASRCNFLSRFKYLEIDHFLEARKILFDLSQDKKETIERKNKRILLYDLLHDIKKRGFLWTLEDETKLLEGETNTDFINETTKICYSSINKIEDDENTRKKRKIMSETKKILRKLEKETFLDIPKEIIFNDLIIENDEKLRYFYKNINLDSFWNIKCIHGTKRVCIFDHLYSEECFFKSKRLTGNYALFSLQDHNFAFDIIKTQDFVPELYIHGFFKSERNNIIIVTNNNVGKTFREFITNPLYPGIYFGIELFKRVCSVVDRFFARGFYTEDLGIDDLILLHNGSIYVKNIHKLKRIETTNDKYKMVWKLGELLHFIITCEDVKYINNLAKFSKNLNSEENNFLTLSLCKDTDYCIKLPISKNTFITNYLSLEQFQPPLLTFPPDKEEKISYNGLRILNLSKTVDNTKKNNKVSKSQKLFENVLSYFLTIDYENLMHPLIIRIKKTVNETITTKSFMIQSWKTFMETHSMWYISVSGLFIKSDISYCNGCNTEKCKFLDTKYAIGIGKWLAFMLLVENMARIPYPLDLNLLNIITGTYSVFSSMNPDEAHFEYNRLINSRENYLASIREGFLKSTGNTFFNWNCAEKILFSKHFEDRSWIFENILFSGISNEKTQETIQNFKEWLYECSSLELELFFCEIIGTNDPSFIIHQKIKIIILDEGSTDRIKISTCEKQMTLPAITDKTLLRGILCFKDELFFNSD